VTGWESSRVGHGESTQLETECDTKEKVMETAISLSALKYKRPRKFGSLPVNIYICTAGGRNLDIMQLLIHSGSA